MNHVPRTTVPALLMLLWSFAPADASGPIECEDRVQEIVQILGGPDAQEVRQRWERHDLLVRQAEPGTALYAPHPFPKSPEEVVADFRYAYFEVLFDKGPAALEPTEQQIYEGLRSGTVKPTVVQVENWGLSRCSPERKVPFYHLVRLVDAEGRELARASILPTGLMGRYTQISEVGARALPGLDELPARVEGLLGNPLKVDRARYAAIDGLPLHCGPLVPCTVFESTGSTWILDRSALLYEVRSDAPRQSISSHRDAQRNEGFAPLGASVQEKTLITRGFEWVEADLVARDDEMAQLQGLPRTPAVED